MKTVTIQIGNSDNKLTQQGWAGYVTDIEETVLDHTEVHFSGGSPNRAAWQNYCWVGVATTPDKNWFELRESLNHIRRNFNQESVALTFGETQFV